MKRDNGILLAFYGDDLTGSTDALEFITRAGARSVLFLNPPTPKQLGAIEGLQAYGVAGLTRALSPKKMEMELLPAFKDMKKAGAKYVHYKVCSTFDSSARIGSIGKAIDCGDKVFKNEMIPVLGGMPALGRYCVFGNLFAQMGIGSKGEIHRLDRHPSMSRHPVTPANESDLRKHIGAQTRKTIGLFSVVQMEQEVENWNIGNGEDVILFDTLTVEQLYKIGEWMGEMQKGDKPLFSVGSSGIEMALGNYWKKSGKLKPVRKWPVIGKAEPLLVLSGSCSPVSKRQISYALGHGFEEMALQQQKTGSKPDSGGLAGLDMNKLVSLLKRKINVIVHTGNLNGVERGTSTKQLGQTLGLIAKEACQQVSIPRIVIAGGDTSSYAGRAMEIDALEMIAPFVNGAPLCIAHSRNKHINRMEVNFKGGQVGAEDYFVQLKNGTA